MSDHHLGNHTAASPVRRRLGRTIALMLLLLAWDVIPGAVPALWSPLGPLQDLLRAWFPRLPADLAPPFGLAFVLARIYVPWVTVSVLVALPLVLVVLLDPLTRLPLDRMLARWLFKPFIYEVIVVGMLVLGLTLPIALVVDLCLLAIAGALAQLGSLVALPVWVLVDRLLGTNLAQMILWMRMEDVAGFAQLTLWGQYLLVAGAACAVWQWSRGEDGLLLLSLWYEKVFLHYVPPGAPGRLPEAWRWPM